MPGREMLEAYTTLGYLAARTARIQLLAWVTVVVYREPGLLAKAVTTLDVLSEGRAWLRIGAASFEQEARGLGLPSPGQAAVPAAQRGAADVERRRRPVRRQALPAGAHAQLAAGADPPATPILIGGGGEKKTLRLVAQYAQACNLIAGPDPPRKLHVLRALRRGRPRLRRDRQDSERPA